MCCVIRLASGAVVNLLEGTHYVGSSVVFTSADSGAAGKPVTWQAYPSGANVTISGGKRLECDWTASTLPSGVAAQKCTVPSGLSFDSLFVNGLRQIRARFPNGDPLTPKSGYSSAPKAVASFPNTAVPACASPNVVIQSVNGTTISKGCDPNSQTSVTVTVADYGQPRHTVTADSVYAKSSRFNDTFNLPVWSTTSTSSISVTSDWTERKWSAADVTAGPAVVKMMHPSGWGSWVFEVGSFEKNVMTFSAGGNQEVRDSRQLVCFVNAFAFVFLFLFLLQFITGLCFRFTQARGGQGAGASYIENILGELDVTNEWYLDRGANTLYYLGEHNMTSADVIEVPLIPRILQFRGSRDDPVHDIVLTGFNISHAAPTFLESYEDPSGGDWSIHRGAAVFLDGTENIVLQHLSFDQVGGNGVFLSNYAYKNSVLDCDFWRTGDT